MNIRRAALAIMAAIALSQSGCLMLAATAVGGSAAGVAYVRGRYTETVAGNVRETATATLSALHDIGMPADKQNIGRTGGEIDAWTPNGHPLMIDLESIAGLSPEEPPKTKVGIRFGPFGDKSQSERIIAQIEYRLENPAATPPQAPPQPPAIPTDEPPLAK
jgi:hypothetical protein